MNKKTTIDVPIEKGVPHEHDYIIHGEANAVPGKPSGNLHIRFKIQPHKIFERKGADLFVTKKITLLEALTGFTFTITHLDGSVINLATERDEIISHS